MAEAAESTYAAEQEALRKKQDGEVSLKDQLRVPEVNPEVYRDVTPMLFRGFLTVPATINDVHFVFKSLNQHEFELIRLSGWEGSPAFWDYFLAYAVLLVDGKNVIRDRDAWLDRLALTFHEMPRGARQKVIRYLSELNRRASDATILAEAYVMESASRFRWGQVQGLDLTQPAVTGIAGTELLGLNWAQLVWRALNYYEDMTLQTEREWEHAKFVGSCFAGKGVQKIYNQDNERRRKEHDERIARRERILRHVFEGTPLSQEQDARGRVMVHAKTVEELADQLEKSLRGEQDFHDRVISEWEAKQRQQLEDRRQHLHELVERNEAIFEGRSILGGTTIEGLTREEVEARAQRRRQLQAQANARMIVHPELHDPKMSAFLDKQFPEASSRDERVVPLVSPREVGTPFRGTRK